MHMDYSSVTVIPRMPDILTATAVGMIFIVDQKQKEIAGMVEICPSYKYSADGSKIGILRIDLLPEYENEKMIKELLTVILEHIYEDFEVQAVLMKAQEYATERRNILKQFHFVAAMDECNISFRDYFIRF